MAASLNGELGHPWKKRKLNEAPRLCGPCSTLDFRNIFRTADTYFARKREELKISDPRGLFIHSFNGRLSHTSCCRLCRFFWSMRQHQGLSGADQTYSLIAFSSVSIEYSPGIGNTKAIADEACLAVVPAAAEPVHDRFSKSSDKDSGRVAYIYRTRKEVSDGTIGCWGREVNAAWNVEIAREWVDFCRKSHRGNCRRKKLVRDSIRGFKVIDCHSVPLSVVEKSWAKEGYAALSYVWGQGQVSSTTDWPPVIKDAIQVTRDLGIRYLWVDRYCIDQENADEVRYMVARMASIYDGAELTIVAAAGSGSSHGLPGVSCTLRRPQPKLNTQEAGYLLVSGLVSPKASVRDSVWCTRGWTCQEGYLSRKRLIFTEDQLYWECEGMCAGESKYFPLQSVHTANGYRMQSYMGSGLFSVFFGNTAGGNNLTADYLGKIISEYSQRNLSFDSDKLLALQGIAARFSSNGVSLFSGLPVRLGGKTLNMQSFLASLTLWANSSAGRGDDVKPFVGHARRSGFPSWSWAGWKGIVTWIGGYSDLRRLNFQQNSQNHLCHPSFLPGDDPEAPLEYVPSHSFAEYDHSDKRLRLRFSEPLVLRDLAIDLTRNNKRWIHRGFDVSIGLSLEISVDELLSKLKDGCFFCMATFIILIRGEQAPTVGFIILQKSRKVGSLQLWDRIGSLILKEEEHIGRKIQRRWTASEVIDHMELCQIEDDIVVE